jgi:DNA-binding LytR/AlgR family response regulator
MKSSKTNTLNCLIVDDEMASQSVLKHFISETADLELIATCNNATQAFEALKKHPPIDLLFLDINMPQESGLDFYKRLVNPPQVIFTTAYPQYAIAGFEVDATDYLLKPIAYDRFMTSIEKVTIRLGKTNPEYMILNENKILYKVSYESITYVAAFGDYVKVFTKDKTIITHSTFSDFISELPPYFLRVHKSFSVNLNSMSHLMGNQIVAEGHTIPIGQTFKSAVLDRLNNG